MIQMVYYITYIDPDTGFLKRLEFDNWSEWQQKAVELRAQGIVIGTGQTTR